LDRDHLGFEIAWYDAGGDIGAVNHGKCALFLRKTDGPIQGGTFWIFCDDVDEANTQLEKFGANITVPIANTAWGMRQFTVEDIYGNTFYFHHEL